MAVHGKIRESKHPKKNQLPIAEKILHKQQLLLMEQNCFHKVSWQVDWQKKTFFTLSKFTYHDTFRKIPF